MRFYADLHIHSKYSRACSKDCDLEHLAWWARHKGITVLGTGDFTHPAWFDHLRNTLVPAEPGLFRLRDDLDRNIVRTLPPTCRGQVRFMLSVEISTIYKRDDRTRKVHHLVYVPDFEAAAEFNRRLARIGNLGSDGRPILGLDSRDLLEITLESGNGAYLVPAHVWTPWFAVLGSKSGFDAVDDCYADLAGHIFAIETGLSSDPAMNWRVSELDRYRLVSNSDAHSPPMLGREATVFDTDIDYFAIRRALETGAGLAGTIEFFPEEGKYHLDGHRKCDTRLEPAETRSAGGRCPSCGKPLTVGVLHRVEELADRPDGVRPRGAAPYRGLVQLPQVMGEILGVGARTKKVYGEIAGLSATLGPELYILDTAPLGDIEAQSPLLGEAVRRLRSSEVTREAGYDGEYGIIRVFQPGELDHAHGGSTDVLFETPIPSPRSSAPARQPGTTDRQKIRSKADPPIPIRTAGSPPEPSVTTLIGEESQPELLDGTSGGPATRSGRPRDVDDGRGEAGSAGSVAMNAGADGNGAQVREPTGGDSHSGGGLDPEQRAAVEAEPGPLLIVAGPGTGKTRTLTRRIVHHVREGIAAPEQCLAVTFTRRAAAEMAERLTRVLPETASKVTVTTFHALGLRISREQHERLGLTADFGIATEAQRLEVLADLVGDRRQARGLLDDLSAARRTRSDVPTGRFGAGATAEHAGAAAAGEAGRATAAIPPGTNAGTAGRSRGPHDLGDLCHRYAGALRERDLLDFDDLIVEPVGLLDADPDLVEDYRRRFRFVAADEYQDVDTMQYRLLRHLAPPDGDLTVIGDPDQAIYRFRGADVGFFLRFREDYPTARVVELTRNYRSSAPIVAGALQAVAPASLVVDRQLTAVSSGYPGGSSPDDGAVRSKPSRMNVPLTRTRGAGGTLEAAGEAAPPPLIGLHHAADERAEASFVARTIDQLLGGSSFHSLDSGRVDGFGTEGLSFSDIAVLYRTDAQSTPVMEALTRSGIPFQKRSHDRLAARPGVQEIVYELKYAPARSAEALYPGGLKPSSSWAVDPLFAAPPASVVDRVKAVATAILARPASARSGTVVPIDGGTSGKPPAGQDEADTRDAEIHVAVELLTPLARRCGDDIERFLTELALGAEVDTWDPRADLVSLLTLHASKGLEFPVVFIVGCEDGLLPLRPVGSAAGSVPADDAAEERRLLFVGMTRAQHHLFLSHAASRTRQGAARPMPRSPFLADIQATLTERIGAAIPRPRRQVTQLRLM